MPDEETGLHTGCRLLPRNGHRRRAAHHPIPSPTRHDARCCFRRPRRSRRFRRRSAPLHRLRRRPASQSGDAKPIGFAFWTTDLVPQEHGYHGPIHILVGMDLTATLTGVIVDLQLRAVRLFLGRSRRSSRRSSKARPSAIRSSSAGTWMPFRARRSSIGSARAGDSRQLDA